MGHMSHIEMATLLNFGRARSKRVVTLIFFSLRNAQGEVPTLIDFRGIAYQSDFGS